MVESTMALNTPSEAFDPAREPLEDPAEDLGIDEAGDETAAENALTPEQKKMQSAEKKLEKELKKIKKKEGTSAKGMSPEEFNKLKKTGVDGVGMDKVKAADPVKYMQLQHLMNLESKHSTAIIYLRKNSELNIF